SIGNRIKLHPSITLQDKETVENEIGVIRRFFPRKTGFTKVTHWQIAQVEKQMKTGWKVGCISNCRKEVVDLYKTKKL
ncbi:MAG: hypothetical protein ACKPGW_34945, partial [Microcystis panniformis]